MNTAAACCCCYYMYLLYVSCLVPLRALILFWDFGII